MQPEPILVQQPTGAVVRKRVARLESPLFYLLFVIAVVAVFIPFDPWMPTAGLDASWEIAMNEGVARHMSFGREIMFTYGPYAAIGTRAYSPATDLRMMSGSALIALCYGMALLFLGWGRRRKQVLTLGLLLFLATFGSTELLLLSYAFLLVVCVVKELDDAGGVETKASGWPGALAAVAMWSTLGLLPLVKGSLLLPFAVAVGLPAALLLYHRRIISSLIVLLVPILSAGTFWLIAGQSMKDIPAFLRGTLWLTSGYTGAMSTSWLVLPAVVGAAFVVAFIAVAALAGWSMYRTQRLSWTGKLTLALLIGAFFLVTFKHGFVAVGNVSGVFATLAVYLMILGFLFFDRWMVGSLVAVILFAASTSIIHDPTLMNEVHARFGVGAAWSGQTKRSDILRFCADRAAAAYARRTFGSTWNTYRVAGKGISKRMRGVDFNGEYLDAKSAIRRDYPLPALKGRADFYEYDQSVLLASNDEWDPRPILQSYSAYTPELARMDEQHLRNENAPEWVFFELQTIDQRFPSLDDGLSWPALLDNYSLQNFDGRFALLRRNTSIESASVYRNVSERTCKMGETVKLPEGEGALFAEVNLKPTLAGKLLITFFSPPQLQMTVRLNNGDIKAYRVIAEMMRTGFFISPLITTTREFASMMSKGDSANEISDVQTFSIHPTYGDTFFWSSTYELKLGRYVAR